MKSRATNSLATRWVFTGLLAIVAAGAAVASALHALIFMVTPTGDRCESLGPGCDGLTSPQLLGTSVGALAVCLIALILIVFVWRGHRSAQATPQTSRPA